MTVAITGALAQYNHASPLHSPYLYGYCSAVGLALIAGAIAIFNSAQEHIAPMLCADRYATPKLGNTIHSHGYQAGESGLVLVNEKDESAYEIGVYPPCIRLGKAKLCFSDPISRLTKQSGSAQLNTRIETSKSSILAGGNLFDFMQQAGIPKVRVPIVYKDAKGRWYKSLCWIEVNVNVGGGLIVKTDFRGRTWKPRNA